MTTTHTITPIPDLSKLNLETYTRVLTQWYIDNCTTEERYYELGKILQENQQKLGLSTEHLNNRGDYDKYPFRMVTEPWDREIPGFVSCSGKDCKRTVCTDAWMPMGYSPSHERMMFVRSRNRYYCLAECYHKL